VVDSSDDENDEEFFAQEKALREKRDLMARQGILTNGSRNTSENRDGNKNLKTPREKEVFVEKSESNIPAPSHELKKRIQEIMDESEDNYEASDTEKLDASRSSASKEVKKRARVIIDSDSE
jgi:hypothetical protein